MYYFYVYSKYVFMSLTDIVTCIVHFWYIFVFCICLYGCFFVFVLVVYIHQTTQPGVLVITICLYFLMSHVMG